MPRVAFVLKSFRSGGMSNIFFRVAQALHDDFEFYFVSMEVEQVAAKFSSLGHVFYLDNNAIQLRNFLSEKKIDLVQYGDNRLFGDAALAAGIDVVVERTDGLKDGRALRSKIGLDAVIASTASTVAPISQLISPEKIHLIYNGVDVKEISANKADRLGFSRGDIIVGRVSIFHEGKNLTLLIEAVKKIIKDHPNVRLVIVGANSSLPGANDEEHILRQMIAGYEENILLVGYLENPMEMINGFDIATCSSASGHEGIPNSLIESMAAAKPVVSTSVDDIPELVVNGVTGILVPDGDVDAFADAIRMLVNDERLRLKMGTKGRDIVANKFDITTQAALYRDLYNQLLTERKSVFISSSRRFLFSLRLYAHLVYKQLRG
jgi:glycosyltransferase involved in cell wall biosynthesis